MQTPIAIYIASFIGSVGLLLMMPKRWLNLHKLGALLGAAALGGLWLFLSWKLPWGKLGVSDGSFIYYYIFSAISIIASVRVITNTRPVYAALWFVMVVLASAGLFLVLGAEFIAFAVIIIYGGAILVTYMFVLMLASQAGDPQDPRDIPVADRIAFEPVLAIAAGFLLLSVLLTLAFEPMAPNPAARAPSDEQIIETILSDRSAPVVARTLAGDDADLPAVPPLADPRKLSNTERVGLDLFQSHPLGLELAGVILLLALIGAVVIAKTKVAGEDTVNPEARSVWDRANTWQDL